MISRKICLSIPLSLDSTFDLLQKAGEKLPSSSDVAGIQFGRWANIKADHETGQLEWQMYDSEIKTVVINASIREDETGNTLGEFKVNRVGQILDPLGLHKETLRLLIDPFLELVKLEMEQGKA